MAGLKVKIGADASQFERTMRGVKKEVGGVKTAVLGVGATVGAIWAVNKAFDGMKVAAKGAFDFMKGASEKAATRESMGVQFETLLGSVDAAQDRMEDLVEFAKTTPFQISGLAEASAMLEGMTQGALASGAGLRMVGDAAAAVNKPLEVVGMNIGKLFQGLTQGGEVAEATNQLMQYGLVTGKNKIELQEFVKEAKKGDIAFLSEAEALQKLTQMFGKTEGAMARLAETTAGKQSMVTDAMDEIKVAFGTGFNDGLKDALDAATAFIPKFEEKMRTAGQVIGSAISESVAGNHEMFVEIGMGLAELVKGGFKAGLQGTGETLAASMVRGLSHLSVGVGGKQMKAWMQEQADTIDEGRDAGLRQNMRQVVDSTQERMTRLVSMSDESRYQRGMTTSEGSGVIGGMGLELTKEQNQLLREIRTGIAGQKFATQ
jgi:hypothetical protein